MPVPTPTNLITILQLLGQGIIPGLGTSRNVPAESVTAGTAGAQNAPAPTADETLPTPPEQAPAPASRPTVPVATPGSAQSGRDLPPSARDLLARLQAGQQPDPANPDTATLAAPSTAPTSELGINPLARFGFALAASRNPSLFGQIGEAGLAMQQGQRENRQDANREAEVNVMRDYRQAQADLARAELEWQRDPTNPRAIALLAEARYRDAAAQRAARGGEGGGGGGSGGPFVQIQNLETGEVGFFQPRTGSLVRAPEGFGRPGENAREEIARRQDMQIFGNMNRNNMIYMGDGNALMRDAQAYAEAQAQRRRQAAPRAPAAGGPTGAPAPAPGAPDRIIDLTARTR